MNINTRNILLVGAFLLAIAWILTIPYRNEVQYKLDKEASDKIEAVRKESLQEANVTYCQTLATDDAISLLKSKVALGGMGEIYQEAAANDLYLIADYERTYNNCMQKYD